MKRSNERRPPASPYRDDPRDAALDRLEKENAALRSLVGGLFLAALVFGGVAAFYFEVVRRLLP